ncbi:Ig-like domain-containing protein [Candidatus Parabeggiatoa sp. HSG14]|uniref:Ig-like domain-containing protein n=1 Tax=Candidatus Parabeggiatoa sp. HSG14 TaxID=3055593 RepID=UPI0025A69BA3|nr:lamin tail domain-containing protein [Thiotrichales bacterium HSG14]
MTKKFEIVLILFIVFGSAFNTTSAATSLIISGVIDGPLSGGTPKAIEFYVINDIPDLSIYGFGSANNGGGTDGEEYTFSGLATGGDFIYIAYETIEFNNFFGFNPDDTDSAANINGDDAIELFQSGVVVDVFGDINVDGSSQNWEYLDGWAYRKPGTNADGSTFNLGNWTFSGPNALDGAINNASATSPFLKGTFNQGTLPDTAPSVSVTTPANNATNIAINSNITVDFNENVTVSTNWFNINCTSSNAHTATVSGGPKNYILDPNSDFVNGETCTITTDKTKVADQDGTADNMVADYSWNFTVTPAIGSWIINEILADPHATEGDANSDGTVNTTQDEFVEVINNSGGTVDISGWTLADAIGVKHTFPPNTVLLHQCAIVVFSGGALSGTYGNAIAQLSSTGQLDLNNTGDTVTLNDGIIDQATYTYGTEGGDNQSLSRDPDITGASFVKHSIATNANGTLFSPGTRINGLAFSSCVPTAPQTKIVSPPTPKIVSPPKTPISSQLPLPPLPPTMTLTVKVMGNGFGNVKSNQIGIDCENNPENNDKCQYAYNTTSWVKLRAIADASSEFRGWGGHKDCADSQLWMTSNKLCVAYFKKLPIAITDNNVIKQINNTARFLNFSTRAPILSGINNVITGFVITGNGIQKVMIKGIALEPNVDPTITIQAYPSGEFVASNDNWQDNPHASEMPNMKLENAQNAALLLDLPAGAYTATLGTVSIKGIGLISIEAIDNGEQQTRLTNLSTRANIQGESGDIIAGFNLTGTQTVLLRGWGLENGVDPVITLQKYPSGEFVARNDNWQNDPHTDEIVEPYKLPNPTDAALLLDLSAGAYTITLSSMNEKGMGLIGVDIVGNTMNEK